MRIGVVLPRSGDWPAVRNLACLAEETGADSLWIPDGFSDGDLEAWTVMSAIAANTERIEVGSYMLNASLRDPVLLAKMVETIDQLAPHRIRIILGTGWDRTDYEALGSEFPPPEARMRRTRETVSMLKGRTPASVEVAGVRDEVLTIVASEADGWAVSSSALDAFFERVEFLRRACENVGRVFADLRISCALGVDTAAERAGDLAEHGMREICVVLPEGTPDLRDFERMVCDLKAQRV